MAKKYCRDCKWYAKRGMLKIPTCLHSASALDSLNVIEPYEHYRSPYSMRSGYSAFCGPNAKYFEPKPASLLARIRISIFGDK